MDWTRAKGESCQQANQASGLPLWHILFDAPRHQTFDSWTLSAFPTHSMNLNQLHFLALSLKQTLLENQSSHFLLLLLLLFSHQLSSSLFQKLASTFLDQLILQHWTFNEMHLVKLNFILFIHFRQLKIKLLAEESDEYSKLNFSGILLDFFQHFYNQPCSIDSFLQHCRFHYHYIPTRHLRICSSSCSQRVNDEPMKYPH